MVIIIIATMGMNVCGDLFRGIRGREEEEEKKGY
jgi:hypothetical protein